MDAPAKPLTIYTDRSRIVARQECARMGYLQYSANGTGWQRTQTALPLAAGIAVHNALAQLLLGIYVDDVIRNMVREYREALLEGRDENDPAVQFLLTEQTFLVAGMVQTWATYRLPEIKREYTIATAPDGGLLVEKEFTCDLGGGLFAMLRMDAVLRKRSTGKLVVWDFKTLAYPSQDWANQWAHNPQTYLYLHAIRQLMGEEPEGMVYEGLIKGVRKVDRDLGYAVHNSPYTQVYTNGSTYQVPYTSKKEWSKHYAWQERSPYDYWEGILSPLFEDTPSLATNLFCVMPPVNPAQWEIDRWLKQVQWAEALNQQYLAEVNAAEGTEKQELVDTYFPTTEGRCFKYGPDNKCMFTDVCFTEDPRIEEMGFVPRVPHHTTETEGV